MTMASKAQRAVTGVPPGRWAQFGKALQAWREDELEVGYEVRTWFAHDRHINLRLVQDLEKNYRPGTYTKWALKDAARAYEIPYEGPGSILAFLHGETDALARAKATPAEQAAALPVPGEPPGWMASDEYKVEIDGVLIARTEADRPYADRIRGRLDMLRAQRITAPSGAQLFPDSPGDARDWDKYDDWEARDRVWFIADLQRRADRGAPNSGTGTDGA
jgi:hypothetical protein